ncbi:hypothetical protein EXIGLDRAFT_606643 [Exidia glandulosa HHB12029]|uniref:Clavaminate synthase-like protein n=1 Tax=Exidia glandulosa HHB12029 TaxID=1314781 RepID=A0A166B875_EXIGL|nr:hypothetical protein EXIGLDRAFT_606643 [Exidia glandulosa HHB12029]
MFRFWFPKLWHDYDDLARRLREHGNDDIGPPFPGFPMHGITINTGKRVATPMHVDFKNTMAGMCVISPFGRFDHTRHGMLVLQELKVIMQVAPGDVVFIPSALITHGNTELGEGETRRSWTMFNPGGLARFEDGGYMTMQDMRRQGGASAVKDFRAMYPLFLDHAMSAHMTLEQLKAHHTVPNHV